MSVAPDGRPRVARTAGAPDGLSIEDGDGRAVQEVEWC